MIAHRLTTLDICDMRIRIDHGKVASITSSVDEAAGTPA
jgi:hypothetical protein